MNRRRGLAGKYQEMEENQDGECGKGIDAAAACSIQGGAVIDDDDSIVGDDDDAEHQQNHDRSQTTECRAELEHVPSHHCS